MAKQIKNEHARVVKPLYVSGDFLKPARVSFQKLGDLVLDLTDAEWKAQFEARQQARLAKQIAVGKSVPASSQQKVTQLSDQKKTSTADVSNSSQKGVDRRGLALVVLRDLKKLSEAGYVTEGKFDPWLLLFAVQLSIVTTSGHELRIKIYEAAKIHNWNLERAMAVMGTVIARAEAAYRGQTEEYNGKVKDTRYAYSQKRMVELLGLDSETIINLDLRALTTPDVKRQRDRIRKAAFRQQKKVAQSKEEVAADRDERTAKILEQVRSGASIAGIAKANKVSRQTVYNVIKRNGLADVRTNKISDLILIAA